MKRTILTLFFLFIPSLAFPQTRLQSLLVSIEKYDLAPLDYAENDVTRFANVLMTRYNGSAQVCIDTPNNERGGDAPMRAVMKQIEDWCRWIGDNDTAVLYLAGHGVKDADGKLYLAMINFDTKNFKTAAIPLSWIRDCFGKAKGKHKLLLLDTCFAGTAKSVDFAQAGGAESAAVFADLKNIVVIASSRANEKSWLWGDAKHSLFTYWVIEAFKGHADANNDQKVSCNEIIKYLQTNVPTTAKNVLNKQQHPVVFNAEAGKDFLLPLRASTPERLIADMAEQIDLLMRLEWRDGGEHPRIAVPEFTSGKDGQFDPKYGTLPRWASEELRKAIVLASRNNRGNYSVLSEKATRQLMQSRGLTPDDLGTEKSKDIKVEGKSVSLLVDGRLELFTNGSVALRAVLLNVNEESEIGSVGGVAMLSAEELSMTGASVDLTVPRRPEWGYTSVPGVGMIELEQQRQINEGLKKRNERHPMADPGNPFKVRFEVRPMNKPNAKYVERKVVFKGNECFLPLSKGEEYRIMVKCGTKREVTDYMVMNEVFVRVLVDGLNTLSQRERVQMKGVLLEAVGPKDKSEYVVMPRVNLSDARAWVMQRNKEFKIEGFYDASGKNSTLQRFQVVDADESAAARKNYTEQLGLITIGFFEPTMIAAHAPVEDDIGTGAGGMEKVHLETYQGGLIPGPMMAVFNIRYLTPEALKKLTK